MSIVAFALKRPYTVAAAVILVCLLGVGAGLRMPTDIFPEIDIPVVSVVWTYAGMSAADIQNRIVVLHERQLASLVDNIERIEANSYDGVGVEKIYLQRGRRRQPRGIAVGQQRAGGPEIHAAEYHAAADPAVWGHGRAHHSIEHVQRHADGHAAQRSGAERHPARSGRGARRFGSLPVRRQTAGHHGRS
jgi:hypothetical protein